jgi:hypothetical protein
MFDVSKERQLIVLSDIKIQDLKSVMEFAYKGEVIVNYKDFESFIKTAKMLQLKGITQNDELVQKVISPKSKHEVPSRDDDMNLLKEVAVFNSSAVKPEPVSEHGKMIR